MSKGEYLWAPGEAPPLIQDHSLAKHQVLARYLRIYVDVLTANPVIDGLRLALVDGFAGGGVYQTRAGAHHFGSPLQMVHAMQEAEAVASSKRTKKAFSLDVEYFFVEQKRRNLEVLEGLLKIDPAAADLLAKDRLHVLQGSFDSLADDITRRIQGRGRNPRALFLLDQYGYSKVPLTTLRNILHRLPNAEILLTFATDWLIDYMSGKGGVSAERLQAMGLLDMAEQFDTLISHKEHRDPRWRRLVQSVLHRNLVEQTGARYFTPFFIVSPNAHREYWFVHLSRHSRARDEMTRLHWELENRFAHYGRNGLGMLGYDPREDVLLSGQGTFNFSEASSRGLITRLTEEIPRRLPVGPSESVAFADFFDHICNETPATNEQILNVLATLSRENVIEVLDAESGKRRAGGVQVKHSDRLRVSTQMLLFTAR